MARVPASMPTEPFAQRCGDSYKEALTVRGTITGTDFGGQFNHQLQPVRFGIYGSTLPSFASRTQFREDVDGSDLRDRLNGIAGKLELEAWAFELNEIKVIQDIANRGLRLLQTAYDAARSPALPGGSTPNWSKIRMAIEESLQHLRCAEYWVWRVPLYKQALAEYEPPFEPGFAPTPLPEFGGLGLPDGLPSEPEVDTGPTTRPPAKKKTVSPWLIVGGLGFVAAVYFLSKKN